ncbi:MAG: amidase family protein [Actinomycetota bacterium]|nr:amidase family protein [Actinomycetota bacterium]
MDHPEAGGREQAPQEGEPEGVARCGQHERARGGRGGGCAHAARGGSDSGGSVRQPAHCCGVYGHFSTAGLVPVRGHLPSVPVYETDADIDLTAVGPLARSADDLRWPCGWSPRWSHPAGRLSLIASASPCGSPIRSSRRRRWPN